MKTPRARLTVTIRRWVDDYQPGIVECGFSDASGNEWLLLEKVPIVSDEALGPNSDYPRGGHVACTIVGSWADESGRPLVRIDTSEPWGVEATTGEHAFDVLQDQLDFVLDESGGESRP